MSSCKGLRIHNIERISLPLARLSCLDGIRGIAVLIVFLSHSSGRESYLANTLNFSGIGHVGVYLFFSLSAFLLGIGLFQKESSLVNTTCFFVKRFFRIIPLYFLVVTLVFLLQYVSQNLSMRYLHVTHDVVGYLQHLFFIRGDGVFWSIVIEMQFYFVVPLLVLCFKKYPRFSIAFFLFVAITQFLAYLYTFSVQPTAFLISFNYVGRGSFFDVFLCGLIAAYFVKSIENIKINWLPRFHKYSYWSFLILLLLTVVCVSENFLGFGQPFYHLRFFSLLYGIVFASIIASSYLGNKKINQLLELSFLRRLGFIGFSFYLLHMFVFQSLSKTELVHSTKFFISFVIIFLLSTLSYKFIEKPSILVSKRICKFLLNAKS